MIIAWGIFALELPLVSVLPTSDCGSRVARPSERNIRPVTVDASRIPPDFTAASQEILGWKKFWLSKIRTQFKQAIHNWWRDGIIADETLEDLPGGQDRNWGGGGFYGLSGWSK